MAKAMDEGEGKDISSAYWTCSFEIEASHLSCCHLKAQNTIATVKSATRVLVKEAACITSCQERESL